MTGTGIKLDIFAFFGREMMGGNGKLNRGKHLKRNRGHQSHKFTDISEKLRKSCSWLWFWYRWVNDCLAKFEEHPFTFQGKNEGKNIGNEDICVHRIDYLLLQPCRDKIFVYQYT